MGTYSSIQTRVLRALIDAPSAVQAEVPLLVNEAIRAAETDHNYFVMQAMASLLTTVETRALGCVPSDWKEWRQQITPVYLMDQGTSTRVAWATDQVSPALIFGQTDVGPPRLISTDPASDTGGMAVSVWPLPDGQSDYPDGEYRVNVPYWRYLPDLSSPTDTNWFTVNGEEYIIYKAVARGFMLDWDEQRAAFWEASAQNKLRELKNRDKRLVLSNVSALIPHTDGMNSPFGQW